VSEPVVVTSVATEGEAEIVLALLRASGIECGERPTGVSDVLGGGSMGRQILVAPDDLERAREVLAASQGE
jgi:hypothetical protein